MAPFFPNQTGTFRRDEAPFAWRFLRSLLEVAVVTGVVLRVYRALALSILPNGSVVGLAAAFGIGLLLLLAAVTLHLGMFTLRHWLWRAPLFAVIEGLAESAMSLALIVLHREPLGSTRAAMGDWTAIAGGILKWRLIGIVAYAVLLAGVVQIVRYFLLRSKDHREHTLEAIHHDAEAQRKHAD